MKKQTKYLSPEVWAKAIAKAWLDEEFKQKIEYDPVKTIRETFPQEEFTHLLRCHLHLKILMRACSAAYGIKTTQSFLI